jgi:AraC-like DNA-binding protein
MEFKATGKEDFLAAIAKYIGTKVENGVVKLPTNIGTGFIKGFKINPHMQIVIRQYELKEDWVLKRMIGKQEKEVIVIAFHNIFNSKTDFNKSAGNGNHLPSVQINTAGFDYELFLPAKTEMNAIIIMVHVEYLKELLNPIEGNILLRTITSGKGPFLFEEPISSKILDVASEIVEAKVPEELQQFYFKIKAEELIFLLFVELLKRRDTSVQVLNGADIKTIYQVKEKMLLDLDLPPRLKELAKFSGMSESKLKRLFKQIFGKSIYHYYQSFRMREAAYLIKEEKLSVSEAGYRLGFSNLSHFTRIFETHIGLKPKAYSMDNG